MKNQRRPGEKNTPAIEEVSIYFNQKGLPESEALKFFLFYEKKQWKSKNGNLFKKWKEIAHRWIAAIVQDQPLLFNRQIH